MFVVCSDAIFGSCLACFVGVDDCSVATKYMWWLHLDWVLLLRMAGVHLRVDSCLLCDEVTCRSLPWTGRFVDSHKLNCSHLYMESSLVQ